jgi:hypothetical protein
MIRGIARADKLVGRPAHLRRRPSAKAKLPDVLPTAMMAFTIAATT